MPVEIHGKDYKTVAERIHQFRKEHPDLTIETQMIHHDYTGQDGELIVMKALIMAGDKLLATGYAEEIRGSSNINMTDPMENCETGAVGRCLAFLGYLGTDVASVEEIADARLQQLEKDMWAAWAAHTETVERCRDSLLAIRKHLEDAYAAGQSEDEVSQQESAESYDIARECWNEMNHDDQRVLWRATTKGGWFTTRERQQMKYWSNEFETTRK